MNILDKIVARKKEEIAFSKSKISVEELKNSEYFGRETFSLKESVKARNGIIAEFKRQSPSKDKYKAFAEAVLERIATLDE
jgi:indole-3-glycerol phosphate synthase